MQDRKLIIFSVVLLLAASTIISVLSSTAVANSNDIASTPELGKYLLIKKYPDWQAVQRGKTANFTIIVSNIDAEVNLADVVVQDNLAPDCNRHIGNLPADSNFPTYICSLENIQEPLVSWTTVEGTNSVDGELDSARDSAVIDLIDISVAVDADPSKLPQPGGDIKFSVLITNTGSVTVTLNSLTSSQFGDITDPENGLVSDNNCVPNPYFPILPPQGNSVTCSFRAEVLGDAATYPVEITAHAADQAENGVDKSGMTTIDITTPISYAAYFPLAVDTLDEPNDNCSAAYPIHINQAYYFFPDDRDDWYYFDLSRQGHVLVELSNFVPLLGQIVIYKGGHCDTLQILKNNGNAQESKPVPLGIQPAGRYYILVINDGTANNREPYTLQVSFQKS